MGTQKNCLTEMILLRTHNIESDIQIRILEHAKRPLSRAVFNSHLLHMGQKASASRKGLRRSRGWRLNVVYPLGAEGHGQEIIVDIITPAPCHLD